MTSYKLYIDSLDTPFDSLTLKETADHTELPTWSAVLSYANATATNGDSIEIKRRGNADASYVSIFKGLLEYNSPSLDNSGKRGKTVGGRHTVVKLWKKWTERYIDSGGFWTSYYPNKIVQFMLHPSRSTKPSFNEQSTWVRVGWGLAPTIKTDAGETNIWNVSVSSGSNSEYLNSRLNSIAWTGETGNQNGEYILVTLEEAKHISGIRVEHRDTSIIEGSSNNTKWARSYKVEVSPDNSNWYQVATKTYNAARNIVESWDYTALPTSPINYQNIKYIKFSGTQNTAFSLSATQVYIYESAGEIAGITEGTLDEYLPLNCSKIVQDFTAATTTFAVEHVLQFAEGDTVIVFNGVGGESSEYSVSSIDALNRTVTISTACGIIGSASNSPWLCNTKNSPEINIDYMRRTEAIEVIAKLCLTPTYDKPYEFWVTDDGAVNLETERGTDRTGDDPAIAFSYAINIGATEHNLDERNKVDSILVLGKKGESEFDQDKNSSGWVSRSTPASTDYESVIVDNDVDSEAAAKIKAKQVLSDFDIITDNANLVVKDIYASNSWDVGDSVSLVDSATGITGTYRILQLTRSYDGEGESVIIAGNSKQYTISSIINGIAKKLNVTSLQHSVKHEIYRAPPGVTDTPGFLYFYEAESLSYERGTGKTTYVADANASGKAYLKRVSTDDSGNICSGPGLKLEIGMYRFSVKIKVSDNTSDTTIITYDLYSTSQGSLASVDIAPSDFIENDTWYELYFEHDTTVEYTDLALRLYFTTGITDISADWLGIRAVDTSKLNKVSGYYTSSLDLIPKVRIFPCDQIGLDVIMPGAVPAIGEHYHDANDGTYTVTTTNFASQTFTTGASEYIVTSIKLLLYRSGTPGDYIVGIRATDINGHPTGNDLSTGTLHTDSITTEATGAWYEILMSEYVLFPATVYAIVLRSIETDE